MPDDGRTPPALDGRLEKWRAAEQAATSGHPIPGYDGYEADPAGQIWSTSSNWRGYGVRPLVQHAMVGGYMRVRLYRNGKRISKQVHTLVALAFHGIPLPGQEVRHLDGNRTNNAASNLAWGTRKENAADRDAHGRTARGDGNGARLHPDRLARGARNGTSTHPEKVARGARQGSAKLDDNAVRRMRELYAAGAQKKALARQFGIDPMQVGRIVARKAWTHVA